MSDDGLISDDELDALFGDNSDSGDDAAAAESSDVSQDDIDALLGGGDSALDEAAGDDDIGIDQDDIDALLGGDDMGLGPEPTETPAAAASQPTPDPMSNAAPESAAMFDTEEPLGDQVLTRMPHLEGILDLKLHIEVVYGHTRMPLLDIMRLMEGDVVKLDKISGQSMDILVNGKFFARGEALVVNRRFSVKINELVSLKERVDRLKTILS